MEKRVIAEHGFGPIYDKNSEILILGSFPSLKSRKENFYYANPRNRFWKVIAAIIETEVPVNVNEKKEMLLRNKIAVYDVIKSCSIEGSKDSSIKDVKLTDLLPVIKNSQIGSRIYTNGNKAWELYMKYTFPITKIEAIKLPSTSPANAAWSLDRLIAEWQNIISS